MRRGVVSRLLYVFFRLFVSADKIVVGSFQGLVRIYKPSASQFSASHVILEQQFSSPVLQVAVGRFVKWVWLF